MKIGFVSDIIINKDKNLEILLNFSKMEIDMKKVIITGGSRGIGRACVELFSENECAVAFIYCSSDDAAEECAAETGAASAVTELPSTIKSARQSGRILFQSIFNPDITVLRLSSIPAPPPDPHGAKSPSNAAQTAKSRRRYTVSVS